MNFKLTSVLLLLVLISVSVFAAAPTVTGVTLTPAYTNDLNYFGTPLNLSLTASGDVNGDSLCWYLITTGGTAIAADWNSDTNICSVTGFTNPAGTGDYNFSMIVQNTVGDANGTSAVEYYWRDTNAPTVAKTDSGSLVGTSLTLTCTDTATNTGLGSGCATIYYSTDGGTTYSSASGSSTTVSMSTVGSFDVNYYAVDNIGNTGTTYQESYTIRQLPVSTCGLIALSLFIVAAALLIFGAMGLNAGGIDIKGFVMILVVVLIVLIIAWTIYGITGCSI